MGTAKRMRQQRPTLIIFNENKQKLETKKLEISLQLAIFVYRPRSALDWRSIKRRARHRGGHRHGASTRRAPPPAARARRAARAARHAHAACAHRRGDGLG